MNKLQVHGRIGMIFKVAYGSEWRQKEKCILYDSTFMKCKNMQRDTVISKVTTVDK